MGFIQRIIPLASRFFATFIMLLAVIGCGGGSGGGQSSGSAAGTANANIRLEVVNGTGSALVTAGNAVSISAGTPDTNYYFSHWSSQDGGEFADRTNPTTTFTVPNISPVNIRANFIHFK